MMTGTPMPRCPDMTDTDAEIRTFQCVLDQGHAGPHEPYVAPTVDEWRADVHDHAVDALRYLARHLCDALESEARRADEADAGAAAMRESLGFGLGTVDVPSCVANGSPCEGSCACHDVEWRLCACGAPAPCVDAECPTGRALASDAGRALLDRLHAAEAESDRLRAIVSYCASAIGSGSACSPRASLEFMEGIPAEIKVESKVLKARIADLKAALEAAAQRADDATWDARRAESERDPPTVDQWRAMMDEIRAIGETVVRAAADAAASPCPGCGL